MAQAIQSKRFKISLFVGATVLFLLLNVIAGALFAKYKEGKDEDFAAEAIKSSPTKPDVVFAGSSTVLYPLYLLDLVTSGSQPALEHYSRIHFAENTLSKIAGRKVQVNNTSFLGFMISDDLFVIKNYLQGPKAPEAVVMMVAPRDFCDNLFESPAAGIAFRKLSSWSNTAEFCGTYLTQPNDYIDFLLGKGVFVYAMRAKIQDKLYDHFNPQDTDNKQTFIADSAQTLDQKWAKSIREYTTRYKNISFEKMQKQFVFLNRLLDTCKERNIRVVLINSPLTARSLQMLPDRLYDSYCKKLADTAKASSCTYFDFSHSKEFTNDDFCDIVHLNEDGAQKVFNAILPELRQAITKDATVKTASTETLQ